MSESIRDVESEIGTVIEKKEDMLAALRGGFCVFGCKEMGGELYLEQIYELQRTVNPKYNILYLHEGYGDFESECICAFCVSAYMEQKWVQEFYGKHDVLIKDDDHMFSITNPFRTIDICQLTIQKRFNTIVSN